MSHIIIIVAIVVLVLVGYSWGLQPVRNARQRFFRRRVAKR